MKKLILSILVAIALVPILYVVSFFYMKGWPFSDHINVGNRQNIYVLSYNLRMNVHDFIKDPKSEFYNPVLLEKEEFLFKMYYPLIKIDRLFGNYHLFDENIPFIGP